MPAGVSVRLEGDWAQAWTELRVGMEERVQGDAEDMDVLTGTVGKM